MQRSNRRCNENSGLGGLLSQMDMLLPVAYVAGVLVMAVEKVNFFASRSNCSKATKTDGIGRSVELAANEEKWSGFGRGHERPAFCASNIREPYG